MAIAPQKTSAVLSGTGLSQNTTVPTQASTTSLSQVTLIDANNQLFTSFLLARLIDNEQFITALAETNINSMSSNEADFSIQASAGQKIVPLKRYKNSNNSR